MINRGSLPGCMSRKVNHLNEINMEIKKMKLMSLFFHYTLTSLLFVGCCSCSNKTRDVIPTKDDSDSISVCILDTIISSASEHSVSVSNKPCLFDTIIASARHMGDAYNLYYIPDTTRLLPPIPVEDILNIVNIKDIACESDPISCERVWDNGKVQMLVLLYEGEDFFSYLCSVSNNKVIDYLHIDGMEMEPSMEMDLEKIDYELTLFAILSDYSIKVTKTVNLNRRKTIVEKTYTLDNNGKLVELTMN